MRSARFDIITYSLGATLVALLALGAARLYTWAGVAVALVIGGAYGWLGYGVIFRRQKRRVTEALESINWRPPLQPIPPGRDWRELPTPLPDRPCPGEQPPCDLPSKT